MSTAKNPEEPTKAITKTEAKGEEAPRPAIEVGKPGGGLIPQTFDQLYRLSAIMAKSGMMPKGLERPEQIFVALEYGLELGLSPMAAVQNIAVIGGRPTIWGDAALGLVRASGLCESHVEEAIHAPDGAVVGYRVTSKRKGEPTATVREFTEADARKAKLWGKAGPWTEYSSRMLQMRARSWALRDAFPDVLKGLSVYEEAQDIELVPGPISAEEKTSALKDRLIELKQRAVVDAKPVITLAEPREEPADPETDEELTLFSDDYSGGSHDK